MKPLGSPSPISANNQTQFFLARFCKHCFISLLDIVIAGRWHNGGQPVAPPQCLSYGPQGPLWISSKTPKVGTRISCHFVMGIKMVLQAKIDVPLWVIYEFILKTSHTRERKNNKIWPCPLLSYSEFLLGPEEGPSLPKDIF